MTDRSVSELYEDWKQAKHTERLARQLFERSVLQATQTRTVRAIGAELGMSGQAVQEIVRRARALKAG